MNKVNLSYSDHRDHLEVAENVMRNLAKSKLPKRVKDDKISNLLLLIYHHKIELANVELDMLH